MKIMILADPSSAHTIKWVNALSKKGLEIFLFGLTEYNPQNYYSLRNVRIYSEGIDKSTFAKKDGSLTKIIYLKQLKKLKMFIDEYKPDILHAHYASSYGTLGALSGFHPFIISVWGADVFNFPNSSFLHKTLLKYNLKKADRILSTSKIMAQETGKYTTGKIEVLPFGINPDEFFPREIEKPFAQDDIVIGTVKTLEKKYGIEYLIKAFRIVKDKNPDKKLKLLIVGGGSQLEYLKSLAKDLDLSRDSIFTGQINYSDVPRFQNMPDIFVSLSTEQSESFGVAVLEACACEKPVVVTNVGGLPEIVEDKITGLIVEKENADKAAEAIDKLIRDSELRITLGKNGREKVKKLYNLDDNVARMIDIYNELRNNSGNK